MDMITLAMAKKYSDSKGGYSKFEVVFPKTELALDTSGSPFEWRYSPAPFVLSEGQRYKVVWNGVEYVRTAVMDDSGIGMIGNVSINFSDAVDTGEPFLIGYRAEDDFVIVFTLESTATMSISTETVHPIDPKYLPSAVVDLDELGLTNPILLKFNEGGGSLDINPDNNYGIDTEKVCKAFPLDKGYNVKLTIPGMGIMAVNPVYTLFTDGKFRTVHLDSYVYIGDVLKKFYVRINGSYPDSGFYRVLFEVGFYE